MSNQRGYKKRVMRNNGMETKKFIKVGKEEKEVSAIGDYKFKTLITQQER